MNKLAVAWRNDSARFVSLKNNRNESFIHNAPSSLRFLIKRVKNVLLMSSLRSRINSLERWPRSDLLLKTLLTRSKVQVLFIQRSTKQRQMTSLHLKVLYLSDYTHSKIRKIQRITNKNLLKIFTHV